MADRRDEDIFIPGPGQQRAQEETPQRIDVPQSDIVRRAPNSVMAQAIQRLAQRRSGQALSAPAEPAIIPNQSQTFAPIAPAQADTSMFDKVLANTLGYEGTGVDRNEVGSSGISKLGVTQQAWDAYSKGNKLPPKSVTKLSDQERKAFYQKEYAQPLQLDKLPEKVAMVAFDYGVNAGPGRAARDLQTVLGVKADGQIGPKTLAAIKAQDPQKLAEKLLAMQESTYARLVRQDPQKYGKFANGWQNRVNAQREKLQLGNFAQKIREAQAFEKAHPEIKLPEDPDLKTAMHPWVSTVLSGATHMAASIARIPAYAANNNLFLINIARKAEGKAPIPTPDYLINNPVTEYLDRSAELLDKQDERFGYTTETDENGITSTRPKNFEDIVKEGDKSEIASYIGWTFMKNSPQILMQGGFMIMRAGTLGSVILAGLAGADKAKVNSLKKDLDVIKSQANVLLSGVIEGAAEKLGTFGMGPALSKMLVKEFGEVGARSILMQAAKTVAKGSVMLPAGEGFEEVVTEFANAVSDYALGVDKGAFKGIGYRMAEAFAVGALSGGAMTGPISLGQAFAEAGAKKAQADAERIKAMREDGQRNKVGSTDDGEISWQMNPDGSVNVTGPIEKIRMLTEAAGINIKGIPNKTGATFSSAVGNKVMAALRGEKPQRHSRSGEVTEHEVWESGEKKGTIKGAPEPYNTKRRLPALRKILKDSALEGVSGRYWYENSGRAIMALMGGDKQAASKFSKVLAAYSPSTSVAPNMTNALKAWFQWLNNEPIKAGRFGAQDENVSEILYNDAEWEGEKTNNFYINLMRVIDPENFTENQGVTNDMWMMRMFGYPTDAPTAQAYRFVENETNRLAKELGWEPQQVQAAIWTAIKTRAEDKGVKSKTDKQSERAGDMAWVKDEEGKKARKFKDKGAEARHRERWFENAVSLSITPEQIAAKKFDFADAMIAHRAQVSWESRPGRSTGVLPEVNDAPMFQQMEFHEAISKALKDENGVDILARELGLPELSDFLATGVWEGQTSPGTQTELLIPPRHKPTKKNIKKGILAGNENQLTEGVKEVVNAYAATMGRLLFQEGVGWHRPFYATTRKEARGTEISIGRTMLESEIRAMYTTLSQIAQANGMSINDFAFIPSRNGLRILNYTGQDNVKVQDMIMAAAENALEQDFERDIFAHDGELVTNDWKAAPNGEMYQDKINNERLRDSSARASAILTPKIRAVHEDFARRYGWSNPANSGSETRYKVDPTGSNLPIVDEITKDEKRAKFLRRIIDKGEDIEFVLDAQKELQEVEERIEQNKKALSDHFDKMVEFGKTAKINQTDTPPGRASTDAAEKSFNNYMNEWDSSESLDSKRRALQILSDHPEIGKKSVANIPDHIVVDQPVTSANKLGYKAFNKLADNEPFTIYRAGRDAAGRSWTFDKDIAQEFADKNDSDVISKQITKGDIAYFHNSADQEVILKTNLDKRFSRPGTDELGNELGYEEEQRRNEEGKSWIEKYLPELAHLLEQPGTLTTDSGIKLLGDYLSGRIRVLSGQPLAIYKHEGFHAFFDAFVGDKTKIQLLDNIKKEYAGSVKEYMDKYDVSEDRAAEEVMAELMEHVDNNTPQYKGKTISEKLVTFFRKLIQRIRAFFGHPMSQIQELQDAFYEMRRTPSQARVAEERYLYGGQRAVGYDDLAEEDKFVAPDKRVRFEIPDEGAELTFKSEIEELAKESERIMSDNNINWMDRNGIFAKTKKKAEDAIKSKRTLGAILDHPELYQRYPWAKDVPVLIKKLPGGTVGQAHNAYAMLSPEGSHIRITSNYLDNLLALYSNTQMESYESFRKVLLHEVQHMIQAYENFAQGGTTKEGLMTYLRLLGEVESRDVEARSRMTDEQRRAAEAYMSQVDPVEAATRDNWKRKIRSLDEVIIRQTGHVNFETPRIYAPGQSRAAQIAKYFYKKTPRLLPSKPVTVYSLKVAMISDVETRDFNKVSTEDVAGETFESKSAALAALKNLDLRVEARKKRYRSNFDMAYDQDLKEIKAYVIQETHRTDKKPELVFDKTLDKWVDVGLENKTRAIDRKIVATEEDAANFDETKILEELQRRMVGEKKKAVRSESSDGNLQAEGDALKAAGISRYKAAFLDTRTNKVIQTGAVHDLNKLSKKDQAIIDKEEGQNIDNEDRTIQDGFVDTSTGEYLSRAELQEKLDAVRTRPSKSSNVSNVNLSELKREYYLQGSEPASGAYKVLRGDAAKTYRSDLDRIKSEIRKSGMVEPIIVDDKNKIIDGQHRVDAMSELGYKKIPVIRGSVGSIFDKTAYPKVRIEEARYKVDERDSDILKDIEQKLKYGGYTQDKIKAEYANRGIDIQFKGEAIRVSAAKVKAQVREVTGQNKSEELADLRVSLNAQARAARSSATFTTRELNDLKRGLAETIRLYVTKEKQGEYLGDVASATTGKDILKTIVKIDKAARAQVMKDATVKPGKSTKQIVRETTGQVQDEEAKELAEILRGQEEASQLGFKAGVKEGMNRVKSAKEILERRRSRIAGIRDMYGLSDADLRKINKKEIRLMTDYEFKNLIQKIDAMAANYTTTRDMKNQVLFTINDLELKKVENLIQAMKLPSIESMSAVQLDELNDVLMEFQKGDEFLSVRKLETVKNTELAGIHTVRQAKEVLAKKLGVSLERVNNIKVAQLDAFKFDAQLARENPFYQLLVDDTAAAMLEAEQKFLEMEDEVDDLTRKSRSSVGIGEKVGNLMAATDVAVFDWLEAPPDRKARLAARMTSEQIALASYLQARFAQFRDYLIQQGTLKNYKEEYITHIRRGFLETVKSDGLVTAFKEVFSQAKEDEAMFNILQGDTQNILPLEKFFQFAMRRSGELKPSQNVSKAFKSYTKAMLRKQALDKIVPALMTYAEVISPKNKTKHGLDMDRRLVNFVKEWLNNKKGRKHDFGGKIAQGGKIDLALRSINALTTIIDLGLNIPVGLSSNVGEQVVTYVNMGEKRYATGVIRMQLPKGKKIIEANRGFVGKSIWSELSETSNTLGNTFHKAMFMLFHLSSLNANKIHLLGSLTDAEWKSGQISSERLAQIKREMGRFRAIEGTKSIVGSTSVGATLTKYKTWAIPVVTTVINDIATMTNMLSKGDVKGVIKSREFQEILRGTLFTTIVVIAGAGMFGDDDDDKTFGADILKKAYRESMTLIGALNPSLYTIVRMLSFLKDLSAGLMTIRDRYKTKGREHEFKGLNLLKRTLTPRVIKSMMPEPAKKKSDNIFGGPSSGESSKSKSVNIFG